MRNALVSFIIVWGWSLITVGCVSEDEYIDTAMASGDTWTYGTTAVGYGNQPKVDMSNASGQPEPMIEVRTEPAPGVIVEDERDADALAYISPDRYRVTIDRRVDALAREMNETISWAETKGAAGRAALDPHLRDFRMSVDQALNKAAMVRHDSTADSGGVQDVEYHLSKAEEAVLDARRELMDIPVP